MRLPRLRLKVSTLLAWTAVLALIFTVIAQQIAADRRERALYVRLRQAIHYTQALPQIDRILTNLGIDILKNPTSVELLRDTGPTGIDLDQKFALRVAGVLLDHRNFGNGNCFDDYVPEIGLRIKSGGSSLDLLISLEGSSVGWHQDVSIKVYDETGKQVNSASEMCMNDPAFQKLANELLKK